MRTYLDLLQRVLVDGDHIPSRGLLLPGTTNTPLTRPVSARSLLGQQMRFDLRAGFPMVTTKFVPFRVIAVELLWFLTGDTNTKFLEDNKVTIWREWQDEHGDLGPVYGHQWRRWGRKVVDDVLMLDANHAQRFERVVDPGIDQVAALVAGLKRDPHGRRHILSAWNVADLDKMALPPCHVLSQFFVRNGRLSCHLYQRSGDMFLGVPFNIASYALLTHMLAQQTGLEVGEFMHTIGDAHIYEHHVPVVLEQLMREPLPLPALLMPRTPPESIDGYKPSDFQLASYEHHPRLSAEVVV